MKQRVLEYEIHNHGKSTITMPVASCICKVEYQNDFLRIWAIVPVDTELKKEHTFEVVGTGHEFGNEKGCHCHVETVFQGQFVWHVFEVFGDE